MYIPFSSVQSLFILQFKKFVSEGIIKGTIIKNQLRLDRWRPQELARNNLNTLAEEKGETKVLGY